MARNSRSRLDRLDEELLALSDDAMVLEELDGFIAGLLVCPDLISPSEWLPFVWNRAGADSEPAFTGLNHANTVLGLVMEHYNSVISTLMRSPESYEPLLAIDRRNNDVLWEVWVAGFDVAVKLRPSSWPKLLTADVDTSMAMSGMLALAEVACGDRVIPAAEYDALSADAPDNIARWVVILNNWRLANYIPSPIGTNVWAANFNPKGKVGRNDLCPCGSGRKYKKCCGLN